MLEIKVPATSANLCVGFDCLGLALDIYNTFRFNKSDYFKFSGFKPEFCNDDNLVKQAYLEVFKKANKDIIPVSIDFSGDIPIARGLGSSSSLIVAGVFAANYYLGNIFSVDELFNICVSMEGHPDNVAPAIYGGFTASYVNDGWFKTIKYDVSSDLMFKVIIPDFMVKTSDARKVLPSSLSYSDVVWNLSRIINLPLGLKNGDIGLLNDLFIDKLHEPYRCKLITGFDDLKKKVFDSNGCLIISGSGSTMLAISKEDFDLDTKYLVKNVSISDGIKINVKGE